MKHRLLYLAAALIVGLLWWRWHAPAAAARVAKTLEIDDNVMSPTFGLPINSVFSPQPAKSDVQAAIEESTDAIDGYVVPDNPWGIE